MARRSLHWSLRTGQAAFALVVLGVAVLATAVHGPGGDDLADHVGGLTPASHDELLRAEAGRELLVEGRLSEGSPVLAHGLAAYTRERAVPDIRGDTVWSPDEGRTPPLRVDLAGGAVEVVGDYGLGGSLETTTAGGHRFGGVRPGDAVLVLGRAASEAGAARLEATYVLRGTRASYTRRPDRLPLFLAGAVLVGAGLAVMAWLFRRGYSPFGHHRTGR